MNRILLDIVRIFLTLITSNFWVAKINVAHECNILRQKLIQK